VLDTCYERATTVLPYVTRIWYPALTSAARLGVSSGNLPRGARARGWRGPGERRPAQSWHRDLRRKTSWRGRPSRHLARPDPPTTAAAPVPGSRQPARWALRCLRASTSFGSPPPLRPQRGPAIHTAPAQASLTLTRDSKSTRDRSNGMEPREKAWEHQRQARWQQACTRA